MKKPSRLVSTLMLSAALLLTSFLARKGTASAWEAVADEPPPPEELHHAVPFRDAATWAILSGVAVGLARIGVRRLLARSEIVPRQIGPLP